MEISKAGSLEPKALRRYRHLLNCYEVRRRAKGSRDIDVRARHASEALNELIDGFEPRRPPRYLVVKTRFRLEPAYSHPEVTRRLKDLANGEGYTFNNVKYHVERALKEMVGQLEPEITDPFHATDQTSSSPQEAHEDDPDHQAIVSLAAAAANLHYALLAGLFTKHFNERFQISPAFSHYLPVRAEASDACFERVFESSMHFGERSEEALRSEEDAVDDWLESLLTLIGRTQAAMPATDHLARAGYLLGIHLSDNEGNSVIPQLRDDYRKWYSGDKWRDVSLQNTEPVVAITGAIIILIVSHVELDSPVVAEARAAAHKTLAYYYDFDEHAPLFDGQSLHYHIDSYLDSRSLALANGELL